MRPWMIPITDILQEGLPQRRQVTVSTKVFLVVKGFQLVHTAAVRGHEAALALLFDRRADVNALTASRDAPLTFAVISGHMAVIKKLMHHRADVLSVLGSASGVWSARKSEVRHYTNIAMRQKGRGM